MHIIRFHIVVFLAFLTMGCARSVGLTITVVDQRTRQELDVPVGVQKSKDAWTLRVFGFGNSELKTIQTAGSSRIQNLTLPLGETFTFHSAGYEETKLQFDGRAILLIAPVPHKPLTDLVSMIMEAHHFDRKLASRLPIPKNGVVVVPMYKIIETELNENLTPGL